MLIGKLVKLFNESSLERLHTEIDKNLQNENLLEVFADGETLLHRLVKSLLTEKSKIKLIFRLCDAGIDVNHQNLNQLKTCLHFAVIEGYPEVVYCLLKNGADLTLVDKSGLCAYNYARRIKDKDLSKLIILKMQPFYPTYWNAIENNDINAIRRLINTWCKFSVKKNNKSLIEYAKEKKFKQAFELFISLEIQMDLCFAVFACNKTKVDKIIKENFADLKMNFKNMKDKGATVMYYALQEKNYDVIKSIYEVKNSILTEFVSDELDIDYPVYFYGLKLNLNEDCLKLITPKAQLETNRADISYLYYKGMSLLRYALEINLDLSTIKNLLNFENCSKELITVKDPDYLTPNEFALINQKNDYVKMIDMVTSDYVLKSKHLRMQLALNGYDFSKNSLEINGTTLYEYANSLNQSEVCIFLENVENYQLKIDEFHKAVEKNDYNAVKQLHKASISLKNETHFKPEDIFNLNLINSKRKNESQHILHKAVLNGYYQIIELILELIIEDPKKNLIKLDNIRDHCYRTPMHYANGFTNNKRIVQLLSQFGFSDNVFDKNGITPLDFQERNISQELQELMKINRLNQFGVKEPDPWSWKVWTKIQREKNTLKQLISVTHPHLHSHSHGAYNHGSCQGDEFHSHNNNNGNLIKNHSHNHNHSENAAQTDIITDNNAQTSLNSCVLI